MPSLSKYRLPVPTDSSEFESLVADYYERKCKLCTHILGRSGQKQHGLDIIVYTPDNSIIGIQCKNYYKTHVTTKIIDACVELIDENSNPFNLSRFIIAFASESDAELQIYVNNLSQQRTKQGKCHLELIFWDDIERAIKLDCDMLRKYYPELYINLSGFNPMQEKLTQKDYQHLVQDENIMRLKFLDAFNAHSVKDMLEVDPFAGFNFQLAIDSDIFEKYISKLLFEALPIKDTDIYKNIATFLACFQSFTSKIALSSELINEIYAIARGEHLTYEDRCKYNNDLNECRDKAVNLFRKIISTK